MSVTIRKRKDNRWEADVGKVLGRRRRFVRDSREDADGAAKAFLRRVNDHGADLTMDQAQEASTAFGAIREAGSSMSLLAIVERFLETVDDGSEITPTVGEAIELRLKSMRERNLRPRSIQSTQYRLAVLSGMAGENIASVTTEQLRKIIQKCRNHATQTNVITELSAFFEFCRKRGWIKENPCVLMDKPKVDRGMPKFMDLGTARKLMHSAYAYSPAMAVVPALGLFAGLRPEEIKKLSALDFIEGTIVITPQIGKTRRARHVTINATLAKWIKMKDINNMPSLCAMFGMWRRKNGFVWSNDILRHSFATFFYALHQNAALTCAQMGNSTEVLFKHYRGLVSKEEADKFWSIVPPKT